MNTFKAKLEEFTVFFNNYQEYQDIIKEVFLDNEYQFSCSNLSPFIIDCGSHIGLSILYFKKHYPLSKIIAFEPNPENFFILQKNIETNNLKDIQVINAAASDLQGSAVLYGEFGTKNPRSCGNSLISEWANPDSSKINVETVLLSTYIQNKIDYMKLDIEGSELKVLYEIEDKLSYISELCIEFHGLNEQHEKNIEKISLLLEKHNFKVSIKHKKLKDYFPSELLNWATESKISLATIRAVSSKK